MIPYGRQEIDDSDIEAVIFTLTSDWLTQGPAVDRFENSVAQYCGAGGGVSFNSATSALHGACHALGVRPGDYVWTVPNTFVASANCGLYCGARIDFVDIDPDTWNMCPVALKTKLELAAEQSTLPKVIIPVHFGGASCDMKEISRLANQFEIKIIEDASHSLGGSYRGSRVGSCEWSDITVFSFHPVKMITTGEGGMATSNSLQLINKLKVFRSHGVTRDRSEFKSEDIGPWSYQQIELGYNYRMSDIAATLGCSQLKKLDRFVERRREIAELYNKQLADTPISLQKIGEFVNSSWHLLVVCLPPEVSSRKTRALRQHVFQQMRAAGIGVNVHYEAVHLQPFYRNMGFKEDYCPNAEGYADRCLTLPMFVGLADEDVDVTLDLLFQSLKESL